MCIADLPAEIHNIKKFASWSGFSNPFKNLVIKQTSSKSNRQKQSDEYNNTIKLYLYLHLGNAGKQFV